MGPKLSKAMQLLLAFLLLISARAGLALDPDKRITQYVHRAWSVEDGLPSSSVTALLQTSDGYLWIGTNNGLAQFDGVGFKVFDRRSTPSLTSTNIAALVEDHRGVLWVATLGGGIMRYHAGLFEPVLGYSGLADARMVTMVLAPNGDLLAGGYGGLTQVRNGKVLRQFGTAEGLPGPVMAIDAASQGQIWIATTGGLYLLQNGHLKPVPLGEKLAGFTLRDIFRLRDGTMLLRSREGRFARQIPDGFEAWIPPGISPKVAVRWLLQDRNDSLWLGTEQHGLYRIRGKAVDHFGEAEGFPSSRIRTLLEDRDGSLWLGNFDNGLHSLRDGRFTTWGRGEGLSSDTVYSVLQEKTGGMLVATNTGMFRILGGQVRPFAPVGLGSESIRALYEDSADAVLWVGTVAGLDRVKDGHVTQILATADGLPASNITAVLRDRRGSLWIGTAGGGLARYVSGKVSVFNGTNGLADDYVYAIRETSDGSLWIATANGLSILQAGKFVRHSAAQGILAAVTSLYEDERAVMWIGTDAHGIFRWDGKRLTSYLHVAGFPTDTVLGILGDADARLWFSSYLGVFSVDRTQLDAVAAGTQRQITARTYGTVDGLRSVEGNGGQQPSVLRGRDGQLWFATMQGLSVVNPAAAAAANSAPIVKIDSVVVDGHSVVLNEPVQLPADTRRMELRFAAPNLAAPHRIRYRLRLDGFDTHWNEVGARRMTSFTNLSRGSYRFRVQASNELGEWGGNESVLAFSVAPHLYQTWWFRLLAVILGFALLATVFRLRVAWLVLQNAVLRERQRIAGEIHDNLAQSFSGIFYQVEAALRRLHRDTEATEEHLLAASALASTGVEQARNSVMDLGHWSAPDLVDAIRTSTSQLSLGRLQELRVVATGNAWRAPEAVETHLLRIAQEAVGNALEHGAATSINIQIRYFVSRLTLSIADNGSGFELATNVPAPKRGFGLMNMDRRVRDMGARMVIVNAARGVSVRVNVARWSWARSLGRFCTKLTSTRIDHEPTTH